MAARDEAGGNGMSGLIVYFIDQTLIRQMSNRVSQLVTQIQIRVKVNMKHKEGMTCKSREEEETHRLIKILHKFNSEFF